MPATAECPKCGATCERCGTVEEDGESCDVFQCDADGCDVAWTFGGETFASAYTFLVDKAGAVRAAPEPAGSG